MAVSERAIRFGLIGSTVLFLILSIVFIVLFATKHDDSTSFLLTSYTTSTPQQAQNEVSNVLKNNYHVNDLSTDVQNGIVTSVFSLRGKKNANDIQNKFKGNKIILSGNVTEGQNAYQVCHREVFPATNGLPDTTVAATTHTQGPVTTAAPVVTLPPFNYYCGGSQNRDVVIVVDKQMPVPPDAQHPDDKAAALTAIGAKLATQINFATMNVYVIGVTAVGVVPASKVFATTAAAFQADWNTLVAVPDLAPALSSLKYDSAANIIAALPFRAGTPLEVMVITSSSLQASANDLRIMGAYVTAIQATSIAINGLDKISSSNAVSKFATWNAVAASVNDPATDVFAILLCQYHSMVPPPAQAAVSQFDAILNVLGRSDATNNKCQKLDILFVFDTSQSVVTPYLLKYQAFAKQLAAQYTLSGSRDNDNTHVGVIQFSNDATVLMPLKETTQDAFNAVVDSITYTGGLTNTLAAMKAAQDQFKNGVGSHGKLLIIMTDGAPTVGVLSDSEATGLQLTQQGVDIFFVGDSQYNQATTAELAKINGNHPEWISNNPTEASVSIPTQSLTLFPCPIPVCEMEYYAVEVSEATLGSGVLMTGLQFVKDTANAVAKFKGTARFQLMLYNDQQYMLPKTDTSITAFNSELDKLMNDNAYLMGYMSGHTLLDTAMTALAAQIDHQLYLQYLFQSSVIFVGEANYYTLDPHAATEPQKKASLNAAAATLRSRTQLIYALDGSQAADPFGDDLWTSAVSPNNIINIASADYQKDLGNTGYFNAVNLLDCKLPDLIRCDDTLIDVAIAMDIIGDDKNITDYINTLVSQFRTTYTAHISMFAYGSGQPAVTLQALAAHDAGFSQQGFWEYERWRLGLPLQTTTAATAAADADTMNDAVITNDVLKGLFDQLASQFGCGHYSDAQDRIFSRNVVIFVSDNFAAYTGSWGQFDTLSKAEWGCADCPGTPIYQFLSLTNDLAPTGLGPTFTVLPADFDLTSVGGVNKLNALTSSVCSLAGPTCNFYSTTECATPVPPIFGNGNAFWKTR